MIDSRYILGFALGAGGIFFAFLFGGLLDYYTLKGFQGWVDALSGWVAGAIALAVGWPTVQALVKQTRLLEKDAKRPFMVKRASSLADYQKEVSDANKQVNVLIRKPPVNALTAYEEMRSYQGLLEKVSDIAFPFYQPKYQIPPIRSMVELKNDTEQKIQLILDASLEAEKISSNKDLAAYEAKSKYLHFAKEVSREIVKLQLNIQRELDDLEQWLTTPDDADSSN